MRRSLYERVEERGGFKFIRIKSGRLKTFWDVYSDAEGALTALSTAVSRMFKLVGNDEYDLERVESFVENLEDYVRALRAEIEKLTGTRSQEERIARLRITAGRTPEEAEAFRRKADELEQRLKTGASNG